MDLLLEKPALSDMLITCLLYIFSRAWHSRHLAEAALDVFPLGLTSLQRRLGSLGG